MQAKSWLHSRSAKMAAPTIGVALCTYNGERYVREQVRSIFAQTRLPDLLLACDDASHDGTVAALEELAAQAPFPVRIVRNSANLGFRRNFEEAISGCDADIIVLADQDDWWCPEKLEKIETAFERDPSAAAVFSDAADTRRRRTAFGALWIAFSGAHPQEHRVRCDGRIPRRMEGPAVANTEERLT
jgi:glycosyltransferase involved in cell wall biosynthesis